MSINDHPTAAGLPVSIGAHLTISRITEQAFWLECEQMAAAGQTPLAPTTPLPDIDGPAGQWINQQIAAIVIPFDFPVIPKVKAAAEAAMRAVVARDLGLPMAPACYQEHTDPWRAAFPRFDGLAEMAVVEAELGDVGLGDGFEIDLRDEPDWDIETAAVAAGYAFVEATSDYWPELPLDLDDATPDQLDALLDEIRALDFPAGAYMDDGAPLPTDPTPVTIETAPLFGTDFDTELDHSLGRPIWPVPAVFLTLGGIWLAADPTALVGQATAGLGVLSAVALAVGRVIDSAGGES